MIKKIKKRKTIPFFLYNPLQIHLSCVEPVLWWFKVIQLFKKISIITFINVWLIKNNTNFAHWIFKKPTAKSFWSVWELAISQTLTHKGMQLTTNGSLAAHLSSSFQQPCIQSSVVHFHANTIVCPCIKLLRSPWGRPVRARLTGWNQASVTSHRDSW